MVTSLVRVWARVSGGIEAFCAARLTGSGSLQLGPAGRTPGQHETWHTLCCAVLPCPACTVQVGGSVGDWAAARSPKHGRVFAAQFSVGIGVPIAVLIFKVRRGLGLLAGWSMGLEGGGEMAFHSHGRMLVDGRMDATPGANVL